jgi:hypothetical protein
MSSHTYNAISEFMISEMNASKDLVTNLTMFAPSSEATNGLQRTMSGFGPFGKLAPVCHLSGCHNKAEVLLLISAFAAHLSVARCEADQLKCRFHFRR